MGKSTVFNRLTGLRQHTGNWPGKTGGAGRGLFFAGGAAVPAGGSAGDLFSGGGFAGGGSGRGVFAERAGGCRHCGSGRLLPAAGLILALQLRPADLAAGAVRESHGRGGPPGVTPQIRRLGQLLDVPVVATAARSGKGLAELRHQAAEVCRREPWEDGWKLTYAPPVEAALGLLDGNVPPPCRGAAVGKPAHRGGTVPVAEGAATAGSALRQALRDSLTASVVALAEEIGRQCVRCRARPPRPGPAAGSAADLPAYRLPAMLLLLGLVFYLTIQGANAPPGC